VAERYFIQTYGCQMNEYDSAKMADVLGGSLSASKAGGVEEANILLVNTCSVREKAEDKVFSLLGRWRELKEQNPELIIGVGGCVASQEGAEIMKRAPWVDIVFGPQTLHRLPELIGKVRTGTPRVVDVSFPEIEKFDHVPQPTSSQCTAFLSVMEGCSKACSYCIVPTTRGKEISRPLADVLVEAERLAALGAREITLLGQNVNAYRGIVTGGGRKADLATLIREVAKIDSVERIRFTTSHPAQFNDALVGAYATVPKLASYLHLPVQSGSDRVLKLMKRGYTAEKYVARIDKLKAARPGISISTDFIVGYPGETDEDFEATLALIRYAGRRSRGHAVRGQAEAARAAAGARQRAGRRHQCRHGRQRAAHPGRAHIGQERARARRSHREPALGQFRRAVRARRPVCRRRHHGTDAQQSEGAPRFERGAEDRCLISRSPNRR
jgi:tRNA-2-methylthio-N6-dimethylallyladenosine synthase